MVLACCHSKLVYEFRGPAASTIFER
jgi:hypothetical protein